MLSADGVREEQNVDTSRALREQAFKSALKVWDRTLDARFVLMVISKTRSPIRGYRVYTTYIINRHWPFIHRMHEEHKP